MASKQFRGKICAYCVNAKADVGDHVFAREFFLVEHRNNLPQAPACHSCNNSKSRLEHYLTSLLPFGGRHSAAAKNLTTQVPARLAGNRKLSRELMKGYSELHINDGHADVGDTALPVRPGQIEALFALVVRGLIWWHWRDYVAPHYSVRAFVLSAAGKQFIANRILSPDAMDEVRDNLGDGTVLYQGVRSRHDRCITTWRMQMYGGLVFVEDENNTSSEIGCVSDVRIVA